MTDIRTYCDCSEKQQQLLLQHNETIVVKSLKKGWVGRLIKFYKCPECGRKIKMIIK